MLSLDFFVGSAVKLGWFYAIMVYMYIRYGVKQMKWYVIVIYMALPWTLSIAQYYQTEAILLPAMGSNWRKLTDFSVLGISLWCGSDCLRVRYFRFLSSAT